jgi:lipopolysaccharide heptosyltransferase II
VGSSSVSANCMLRRIKDAVQTSNGMESPVTWQTAHNLLCIRLDSVGDVLMTAPAIRALKTALPGRRVTLLTSSTGAQAADLISEIDAVIPYDPPWMKHTPHQANSHLDREMIAMLESMRFDAVVIFTVYTQSALPAAVLCYLAGIPLRIAISRENPYQLLTDWIVETDPGETVRHEVRRQLDLVANVGAVLADERIQLSVSPDQTNKVAAILREHHLSDDDRWIVIHPGASAASRRYPAAKFARVCRDLKTRLGITSVFTGSSGESPLIEGIQAEAGVASISLAGELSLGELAGLISVAPLLLSNNSGPVHLAAAVGTAVVDLYALTNPQHTPWMVPNRVLSHDVSCKYCYKSVCPFEHHACLNGIEPDEVVDAVIGLMNASVRAKPGEVSTRVQP